MTWLHLAMFAVRFLLAAPVTASYAARDVCEVDKLRWYQHSVCLQGRLIGITIGCLLGMLPLLWYHNDNDSRSSSPSSDTTTASTTTTTATAASPVSGQS